MAIYHPPTFVNAYLQSKIAYLQGTGVPFFPTMPTDISAATDGFSMTQLVGSDSGQKYYFNGAAAIYDRMFKMRRTPFPHIKCEQILYYFYSLTTDAVDRLIEITQQVQDFLDNGDESAQELNNWIKTYQAASPGDPVPAVDNYGNPVMIPVTTINQYGKEEYVLDLNGNKTFEQEMLKTARFQYGSEYKDLLLPFFHSIKVYQLQETRDIIDFATARTYAGNKIVVDYDWHKS